MDSSLSAVWAQQTQPQKSTDSEFFNAASLSWPLWTVWTHYPETHPSAWLCFGWVCVASRSRSGSQASKDFIIISRHFFLHWKNQKKNGIREVSWPFVHLYLEKHLQTFASFPPSRIRQSHRQITTSKKGRIQLCGHFFPSPQAQSLELPQIEFAPWMQTLGAVLRMMEMQWPVFMNRSEFVDRGTFNAFLRQKERSPFSISSFKFGLTIAWWKPGSGQGSEYSNKWLVSEECPAVSTEQPCHFSANPPRTIRKEDKMSAALLGLPLRV